MKIALLDVDGVVIRRHSYFSERLARDFGVPLEQSLAFFKGPFQDCSVGRADLKASLTPYLIEWGWKGSVEDLMKVWFEAERDTDSEVLQAAADLRAKGVKCYLASDNEKYRSEYLLNEVGLGEKFDGAFFSADVGHSKSQPEFFRAVLAKLGASAGDVTYWDDDRKNVEAAESVGIDARFFTGADDLRKEI